MDKPEPVNLAAALDRLRPKQQMPGSVRVLDGPDPKTEPALTELPSPSDPISQWRRIRDSNS